MRDEAAVQLRELNEVVERLRAPGGCPWDREQTHLTLRPYLLEESYEVLEAIESHVPERLREELGDLLLQVLLHSAIAAESEGFDVGDVARVTREKLVHRHPHVFGDTAVSGAAEVVVNWEKLKAAEKADRLSVLDGVPRTLPALAYALGVQKRPARLGFDETPALTGALGALRAAVESVAALDGASASATRGADWNLAEPAAEPGAGLAGHEEPGPVAERGEPATPDSGGPAAAPAPAPPSPGGHAAPPPPPPAEVEEAVGAVLFAAVSVARRLRVNPEDALRRTAVAYGARFRALEAAARADGVDLHEIDGDEWARRWSATEPV